MAKKELWTPQQRIALTWKDLPSRSIILQKLHELLNTIDREGEIWVDIADSKSRLAVFMEDHEEHLRGYKLVTRYSKPCKKKMSSTRSMVWFVKVKILIEYMCQHIGDSANVNFRQAYYRNYACFKAPQLRNLINDIAITCRLHPTSLGVDPAEDGKVFIGRRLAVQVQRIPNVFVQESITTAILTNGCAIPSRVLRVRATKANVRAVVVVEHKNVGTALGWVEKNFADVLIVMTQGFPTWATREFLHTLCETWQRTRFLCYTDHDFQGINIFTTLKYGCIRTAWASDIMSCRRLEWAGPSADELINFHRSRIFGSWRDERAKEKPSLSEDALQQMADKKWKAVQDKLNVSLKKKSTMKEKDLYKNYFKRMGFLDREPELLAELEDMCEHGSKFGLSALSEAYDGGLEEFVVTKTASLTNAVPERRANPSDLRSQGAILFDAHRTGITSSSPVRQRDDESQVLNSSQVQDRLAEADVFLDQCALRV
ncbi:MAG: hypothetical protein Q9208_002434 [Pyrenodesmia sp. 3 TL-2023]